MKKTKTTSGNARSRKLLARVEDWAAACRRLAHKNSIERQKDSCNKSNREPDIVMSITEVVSDSFGVWFAPGSRLKPSPETMNYLERVLDELQAATHDRDGLPGDGLADRVHNVLLHLNFNASPYCQSYIAQITDRVRAKDTPEQKADILDASLKTISQLHCERGMMYYNLYPSIKEFIGGWLLEEIAYMERRAARYNDQPRQSGEYFDNGMPMKILLDTSVARLACVTRALVERGIIQNRNVSDLSVLLSSFMITRRSENVSARAFRLRYYDIEDATRSAVARTLKELARHLETMGA